MDQELYKTLLEEGAISEASFERVRQKNEQHLFSLHWELRSVLYLGVTLLATGLGLLVYENIDSIGHQAVLIFIALLCISCFAYCFKTKLPFSRDKVKSPNSFFDYVLLLANLSFVIFVGYIQFEYHLFGNNYGLATLVPTVVLFFSAYYFDHLGILNMAIASFAVWMGVSVTPKQLLANFDFDGGKLIYTYLLLGILLLVAAYATMHFYIKKHFKFSYQHYGVHVAFIALIAGYFNHYDSGFAFVWLLGVFLLGFLVYTDSMKNRSFYFLLLAILYCYIALSSLTVRLFISTNSMGGAYLSLLYFIGSAIGILFLLINLNKKMKTA